MIRILTSTTLLAALIAAPACSEDGFDAFSPDTATSSADGGSGASDATADLSDDFALDGPVFPFFDFAFAEFATDAGATTDGGADGGSVRVVTLFGCGSEEFELRYEGIVEVSCDDSPSRVSDCLLTSSHSTPIAYQEEVSQVRSRRVQSSPRPGFSSLPGCGVPDAALDQLFDLDTDAGVSSSMLEGVAVDVGSSDVFTLYRMPRALKRIASIIRMPSGENIASYELIDWDWVPVVSTANACPTPAPAKPFPPTCPL